MLVLILQLFTTFLTLVYCADLLRRQKYRPPKGLKLPPGPPGRPIIGHYGKAFQQPKLMKEWREKYGDIVSVHVLGVPYIFVYSDEIARELFENGGAKYSDRPPFNMPWLIRWEYNIGLMRYGNWWRRHIRAFHQFYNSRAVNAFEAVQLKSLRLMLRNLLETPADFEKHLRFLFGQVILSVTYDIDIESEEDTYTNTLHIALEGLAMTMIPGQWLVDTFPIFKYIYEWIPGLAANKFIKKYCEASQAVVNVPFNIVKNRETPDHSFVSVSLERLRKLRDPLPDEETVIRNTAGVTYAAAASTTHAFSLNAIVACLLYPETQRKLQDELDKVIGDRLPTLSDRVNLPYANAFCYEVLRWRPSLPLGVPHAALEDGVLGKYFIPKGSVVIADSLQILHSEKFGPKPDEFDPERYFQPGIPIPIEHFGFGRRMCPGRFFANNMIFLFIASLLKVFDITPMKDENGIDVPISDEVVDESALLLPVPFECSFTPRSFRARDLILHKED